MKTLPLGPVMVGIAGHRLNAADQRRLCSPLVGGVLLFGRNYADTVQLQRLCQQIRALRSPPLLIATDHEGGRVQRFRDHFTALPPLRAMGKLYDHNIPDALQLAWEAGYITSAELLQHGVNVCFAPVVDLDYGRNPMLGDRCLHRSPGAVCELAAAMITGMQYNGMHAVAKHFPGHGHVETDSHLRLPVDRRSLADFQNADLRPYATLMERGLLRGVMLAHLRVPAISSDRICYSPRWHHYLRREMGFDGIVFSDDMSMGAVADLPLRERITAALKNGCDMVIYGNQLDAFDALLDDEVATLEMPPSDRLARHPFTPHIPLPPPPPHYAQYRQRLAALAAASEDS